MAKPCGLLRRTAAILYDALLVSALWFLATVPFIAIQGGEHLDSSSGALHIIYRLTLFIVAYAFFVGFWTARGRTLGMQSWGVQLESADGSNPGLRAATIRFIAACLSWAAFGLGFFWQLWDPEKLTWHDRLSNTRLVYYPRQSKS